MRAGLFPRGRKGWIFVEYLIGVDLGTSGTKTVLFDVDGNVVASKTIEYPLYQEKNGWAEQDPLDWWNAAADTIRAVVTESGVNNADIKGLGISGQMHGLVMLDRDGNVLRRSIIWCDQRTAKECEEITARVGAKRLIEITANPALTGFTASKILWVRNNEPEIYEKCAHILLPKDYVRYMLTGDFATEVSDASGMQLLDVPNRCWSDEVLEKLEIDKALLPKVYESPEITGVISDPSFMGFIPEDRHKTGLVLDFSVAENLVIKEYMNAPYTKNGILQYKEIKRHADEMISKYNVKTPNCDVKAKTLSGGNQQKVVIAREMDPEPVFDMAAHPTRGLDLGAVTNVHDILLNERNAGAAVLFISAELQEIMAVADRIIVLYSGQIMGDLDGETADQNVIGQMMLGQKAEDIK